MKRIAEITLTFENCEWMVLKAEDIKYFEIFGLETKYMAYDLEQYHTINDFIIAIKQNADLSRSGLQHQDETQNTLERFKHKDITSIQIDHDDGSQLNVYVNWNPLGVVNDGVDVFSQTSCIYQHDDKFSNIVLVWQNMNNLEVEQSVQLYKKVTIENDNF